MNVNFKSGKSGMFYKILVLGVALSMVSVGALKLLRGDPPTAQAGPDIEALVGEQITFDGSASSGEIQSYHWYFRDNTSRGESKVVDHTYTEEGIYEVGLVAVGQNYKMDLDHTTVEVKNYEPSAELSGPYDVTEDEEVSFEWTASDNYTDEDDLTYNWYFGDGTKSSSTDPASEISHSYENEGVYTVTLRVEDPHGAAAEDREKVYVSNVEPEADFDISAPAGLVEDEEIEFDAGSSHDNVSDLQDLNYHWDFGEGEQASGRSVSHVYHQKGDYDVNLTVKDDNGETDSKIKTISVGNPAPEADAGPDKEIDEGTAAVFSSETVDNPSDIVEQQWSFGDEGRIGVNRWEDDGDKEATLEAEDDNGAEDTDTAQVDVKNTDPHPFVPSAHIVADIRLRIAGEPGHDLNTTLYENGRPIHNLSVKREANEPQTDRVSDVKFDLTKAYTTETVFTPEDDNDSGPHGSCSGWIDVFFEDGSWERIQHTFNEVHEDTYVWNATINEMLEGHDITFESRVFDKGKDDITTTWSWDDGSTTVNQHGSDSSPTVVSETVKHSFDGNGTYNVELKAEDDDGGEDIYRMEIVQNESGVYIDNTAPLPDAGEDKSVEEDQTFTLSASSKDNKKLDIDYSWSINKSSKSVDHSFGYQGRYLVVLEAVDSDGDTGYDYTFVDVENRPPIAVCGNNKILEEDEKTKFSALSSTDTPSDELEYRWQFGDGTVGYGIEPEKSYPEAGQYTATLTVIDDDEATDSSEITVDVKNRKPSVTMENKTVREDETFVLNPDSSSDTESDISLLSYRWETEGGEVYKGEFVSLNFSDAVSKNVTLKVTDDDGETNQSTFKVEVDDPSPEISYLPDKSIYGIGREVRFEIDAFDNPSDDLQYEWDWDDGSSIEVTDQPFATHEYVSSGTYTLTVKVKDDSGYTERSSIISVGIDTDRDGLTDETEGAMGTDVSDPDSDGDHLIDFYEDNQYYRTDPTKEDTDDDGMKDWYELSYFGGPDVDLDGDGVVCQLDWDSDGDMIKDGKEESTGGYNPTEYNDPVKTEWSDYDSLSVNTQMDVSVAIKYSGGSTAEPTITSASGDFGPSIGEYFSVSTSSNQDFKAYIKAKVDSSTDKSDLRMYGYDGSTWNIVAGNDMTTGVDTENSYVYAQVSQFGTFTPGDASMTDLDGDELSDSTELKSGDYVYQLGTESGPSEGLVTHLDKKDTFLKGEYDIYVQGAPKDNESEAEVKLTIDDSSWSDSWSVSKPHTFVERDMTVESDSRLKVEGKNVVIKSVSICSEESTNPLDNDTDGDGLLDKEEKEGWDSTIHTPSEKKDKHFTGFPRIVDKDGELTDLQEKRAGTDPTTKYTDEDSLPDIAETNGWWVILDENSDYKVTSDPTDGTDRDNDGLNDLGEWHYGTDPEKKHTDEDRLKDGKEVKSRVITYINNNGNEIEKKVDSSPTNPDTDGDGLLDGAEYENSTNPRDKDTDGDGFNDSFEIEKYSTYKYWYYDQGWDLFPEYKIYKPTEFSRKWMFMVYIAADCNIIEYFVGGDKNEGFKTLGDINELEYYRNRDQDHIDITVQLDRWDGNGPYNWGEDEHYSDETYDDDWTTTRRIIIDNEKNKSSGKDLYKINNDYWKEPNGDIWEKEANMGDPDTLVNFVNWSINTGRANTYALTLLSHGHAHKGICNDAKSNDKLTMKELDNALDRITKLEEVKKSPGGKIDLLNFNACFMGTSGVSYNMNEYADFLVASEEAMFAEGTPYHDIINNFTHKDRPKELAKEIVKQYNRFVKNNLIGTVCEEKEIAYKNATLSAIDLNFNTPYQQSVTFIQALAAFSDALNSSVDGTFRDKIDDAISSTERYGDNIDLYDFVDKIENKVDCGPLHTWSQKLMNIIEKIVLKEENLGGHPNSHGLAIYLPEKQYNDKGLYEKLDISKDTYWNEFLESYFSNG